MSGPDLCRRASGGEPPREVSEPFRGVGHLTGGDVHARYRAQLLDLVGEAQVLLVSVFGRRGR
jgi:hypothetical protein